MTRFALALPVFLALAACGPATGDTTADPAFAEAAPDFAGLSLELSGDDGSNATGQPLTGTPPPLMGAVRQTVAGINRLVAIYVRNIERLVATAPALATGTSQTWGPATQGGLDFQFSMTKVSDARYTFALAARATGSGEFRTVSDGEIVKGDRPHRGVGFLRCDVTALHALAPSQVAASGELRVKFAHAGDVKRVKVLLANFKRSDADQAANAAYVYTRLGAGAAGAVKLALHANINAPEETDKTAAEWLLVRSRWVRGFAGRADAVAFGGDIKAGAWVRGRECWDAAEDLGFLLLVYRDSVAATPLELRKVGTVMACHPLLRADPPASELPETEAEALAEAASEADVDADVPQE